MKCSRPSCPNLAQRNGLCYKHHLAAPHGYRDVEPTRQHLERLLCRYDVGAMIDLTNLNSTTLANIRRRRYSQIVQAVAAAILSIPVPNRPIAGDGLLPAVGTARRIEGLSRMGWSQTYLADRVGTHLQVVNRILVRPVVTSRLAAAIADLHDELHLTTGPSRLTAQRSRAKGWAAPLDWDPETIDDLYGRPIQTGKPQFSELYQYFRDQHMTDREIAAEFGVKRESLQRNKDRYWEAS